jgi:glycosyltransferase involved in cell wall biosynthesis
VLPSLEDNLPNTIMEAMACGVPCVGFNVGGIPEMIGHMKTGYVAKTADADDLARGILWTLFEADADDLKHKCVSKVAHQYSQASVALRYQEVYNHAVASTNYKI